MTIGDFDVAPAFERRKHHEEIGGAIALILVITTDRTSRFHRDPQARFRGPVPLRLLPAPPPAIRIPRAPVDRPHRPPGGHAPRLGPPRDGPRPSAGGPREV